jgi:hypothetical protein
MLENKKLIIYRVVLRIISLVQPRRRVRINQYFSPQATLAIKVPPTARNIQNSHPSDLTQRDHLLFAQSY